MIAPSRWNPSKIGQEPWNPACQVSPHSIVGLAKLLGSGLAQVFVKYPFRVGRYRLRAI